MAVRLSVSVVGVDKVARMFDRLRARLQGAGKPTKEMLEAVDSIVSRALTGNFESRTTELQKTAPISILTLLETRKNLRGVSGSADSWEAARKLMQAAPGARPLVDTGALRGSLKKGGAKHVARIQGNTIRIGTAVPYATKQKTEHQASFSSTPIKLNRPNRNSKIYRRMKRVVAAPNKSNNFFADRLRAFISKNPSRTKTVPARDWTRPLSGAQRGELRDALRAIVARKIRGGR